ncbi:MAG: rhodanese-like domain-containing protein [Armatimonadetes bacterium]|nr:rhodanese-like domain-containing protein [Armatimonadota bacterium]
MSRRQVLGLRLCTAAAVVLIAGCGGSSDAPVIFPAEVNAAQLEGMMNDGKPLILADVRSAEEFAMTHIPGAVSYPLDRLPFWSPTISQTARIVCIGADTEDGASARAELKARGFRQVCALTGGMAHWDGLVQTTRQDITGAQLKALMDAGAALQLVDVRSAGEFASGHIPGAVNHPYDQVDIWAGLLVKQQAVVCICASGARSRIAADALVRKQFHRVYNLLGGMSGWPGPVER